MEKKSLMVIILIIVVIIGLAMLGTKSEATTEKELEEYMYQEHNFSGITYIIRDTDKVKLQKFFKENDLTDEQATKIKNLIDEAINLMNEDGATEPNKVSTKEKKTQLISYAKQAAAVMGLSASYDSTETRLDIYKDGVLLDSVPFFWGVIPTEDGTKVITTESKLAKTGSINYEYIIIPGVVLVAGTIFIIARKKANEE